eukprot:266384-Pelagomonas_calceolata.AAC.3
MSSELYAKHAAGTRRVAQFHTRALDSAHERETSKAALQGTLLTGVLCTPKSLLQSYAFWLLASKL